MNVKTHKCLYLIYIYIHSHIKRHSTRDQRTVRQTYTHSSHTEIPPIHTETVPVRSLCPFPTTGRHLKQIARPLFCQIVSGTPPRDTQCHLLAQQVSLSPRRLLLQRCRPVPCFFITKTITPCCYQYRVLSRYHVPTHH